MGSLGGTAGARLLELQATSGATLNLRSAETMLTDEDILECRGSLAAVGKLLPELCSSINFPLPYTHGTNYGSPPPRNDTSSRRWKRTRDIERGAQQAVKRVKQQAWGANGGPGTRGRGHAWRANRGPGARRRGKGQ